MANSKDKAVRETPILRGDKNQDPVSIAMFALGRSLSPIIQYEILAKGYGNWLISKLGGSVLAQGPALVTATGSTLGLSPYRTILLSMAAAAALKQSIHGSLIMQERMSRLFAVEVSVFNAAFDTINTLLFSCAQTSASNNGEHFPQTPLLIGSSLFVVGITFELLSEIQRLRFKKDPANKGKVYQDGLFSLSRHINYFGYTLWRTGYAMAAGGYIWSAVTGAFFAYNFVSASIPELQTYLENKVSRSQA